MKTFAYSVLAFLALSIGTANAHAVPITQHLYAVIERDTTAEFFRSEQDVEIWKLTEYGRNPYRVPVTLVQCGHPPAYHQFTFGGTGNWLHGCAIKVIAIDPGLEWTANALDVVKQNYPEGYDANYDLTNLPKDHAMFEVQLADGSIRWMLDEMPHMQVPICYNPSTGYMPPHAICGFQLLSTVVVPGNPWKRLTNAHITDEQVTITHRSSPW